MFNNLNQINPPPPIDTGYFDSYNHQKGLSYRIQGGKTVKNVQMDPDSVDMVEEAKRDVISE